MDFVEMQIWTEKCRSNSVAAFYIDLSTTGVMDITDPFPLTLICNMNQILAGQLVFTALSTKNAKLLRYQNKFFVCRKRARTLNSELVSCIQITCSGIAEILRFLIRKRSKIQLACKDLIHVTNQCERKWMRDIHNSSSG